MREPTDQEIEATRKKCIASIVETMLAESGTVINHATVGARLEKEFPEFGYDHKSGDDFRVAIDDTLPGLPTPTATAVLSVIEPIEPAVAEPEPEPEPMDSETLREAIHAGEMRRGEIRSTLHAATGARVIARTILAQTLQAFISGRPHMTAQQLAADFCARAAADRQSAKDCGRDRVPAAAIHPRSVLDRQLAFASGGNADDHLRSRFRTGHRRGAVPMATASHLNQERALAAAAKARQ